MSDSASATGPWNEGQAPAGGQWNYVEDPVEEVRRSKGLTENNPEGSQQASKDVQSINQKLSDQRHQEVSKAVPKGENQWSEYPMRSLEPPARKAS